MDIADNIQANLAGKGFPGLLEAVSRFRLDWLTSFPKKNKLRGY
jgi:hypothetical protein